LEEAKKSLTNELPIPIFKYNTPNSNITRFTADRDNFYLAGLNQATFAYQKQFSENKLSIAKTDINYFENISDAKLNELIHFILSDIPDAKSFRDLITEYSGYSIPSLAKFPKYRKGDEYEWKNLDGYEEFLKFKQVILQVLNNILYSSVEIKVFLDEYSGQDPVTELVKLIEKAVSLGGYTLNVETLPYFSLSNMLVITKGCLLFLLESDVPGLDKNDLNSRYFLTGYYKILGFKHTIGSSQSSNFLMMKVPRFLSEADYDIVEDNQGNITIPELEERGFIFAPSVNSTQSGG